MSKRAVAKKTPAATLDTESVCVRPGFHITDADAAKIAPRFFALEQRDGLLTAEAVLADARSPRSPLHGFFEWDDSKAAHAHRIRTAGTLIRAVAYRVQAIGPENIADFQPSLVYVTEQDADGTERSGYREFTRAMASEDTRDQVLAKAKREYEQWYVRYRRLEALAKVIPLADKLLEKIKAA